VIGGGVIEFIDGLEDGVIEFIDGLEDGVIEFIDGLDVGVFILVIGCGLVIASMFLYRPKKARSIKK